MCGGAVAWLTNTIVFQRAQVKLSGDADRLSMPLAKALLLAGLADGGSNAAHREIAP